MSTTSFTYSPNISFAATVANVNTSFTPGTGITCFYPPSSTPATDITRTKLITFLTTGSSKGSAMGAKIKEEIHIGKFVTYLNSISQLDKNWQTSTAALTDDNFYDAFFEAVERIDYDFTGLAVNNKIQFVFNYVATVTGSLPSTIAPSSSEENIHTFKVGVTFNVASLD